MDTKITVVIWTYNRAGKYLEEMIESVRKQTLENIKIIIYDNGSTDGTEEYVKHYVQEDERIQYVNARINSLKLFAQGNCNEKMKQWALSDKDDKMVNGVRMEEISKQHDKLLSMIDTEYLIMTHDDDIMACDMLEKELAEIEKDRDIVAVSCSAMSIDQEGKCINNENENITFLPKTYDIKEYCRAYIEYKDYVLIIMPTVLMKTNTYRQIMKLTDFYNDLGECFELNKRGKIHVMKDVLYKRRLHKGQSSYNRLAVREFIRYWDLPRLEDCCTKEEFKKLISQADNLIAVAKKNEEFYKMVKSICGLDTELLYEKFQKVKKTTELSYLPEHIKSFLLVIKYLLHEYQEKKFRYVIWGAGSAGRKSQLIIENLIANSECVAYIDPYKEGKVGDICIYSADEYNFKNRVPIIVGTTVAGAQVADILEEKDYKFAKDYFFGYGVG